jgi:2'-5' RNA ligase
MRYQDRQKQLIHDIEKGFASKPVSLNAGTPVDWGNDNRLALVTLFFLPEEVQEMILAQVIKPLRAADPSLYYYPLESLHLTIKNIKFVQWPPAYTPGDVEKVRQAFRQLIPAQKAFEMELEGLFEQPSSLSICGFTDDSLLHLVRNLDQTLTGIGVPDNKKCFSADVFFGNVSFCRFSNPPNQAFQEKVQELKHLKIGTVLIDKVWLVETDLVCHPKRTTRIEEFRMVKYLCP